MDLPTTSGCNPEIVSPAGNFEKLTFAVKYGADAVYFGGEKFNLRMQSGNFDTAEIRKAVDYCRRHKVTSVFLLNSFLHEKDIAPTAEYIEEIKGIGFDAVMLSDPGMLMLLKKSGIQAQFHLSTQMSTLNHLSIQFWQEMGISRIVMARETTVEEIRMIREHTGADIEVFIHGALCISYSGRCLLSRFLSGRDANQGSCSHPCRWKFSLIEEQRPGNHMDIIEYARGTEILSSKDLCLVAKVPEYVHAGVNAFKIEGRMKSLYYTANTTRIYRHAVQCADNPEVFARHLPFWQRELDLINHRPYTEDLFNEFEEKEFTGVPYIKKSQFAGYVAGAGRSETEVYVKAFNPIRPGDILEIIYPIHEGVIRDGSLQVKEIIDGETITDMARPGTTCLLRFDVPVYEDGIFRKPL
ncbi:MAG TPA: U32 family peptidase [Spirochaetota bacterium]|nr:U32 family peptidase [Spirochaetota bacterium]